MNAEKPTHVSLGQEERHRSLARRLVHASFREALTTAASAQQAADLITREVSGQ